MIGYFCLRGARLDKILTCVSDFTLRVLACAKISKLPVVRFALGAISSNSLREFFISRYEDKKKAPVRGAFFLIGIARFELTTSCSRSKRSTRLSYIPICLDSRL